MSVSLGVLSEKSDGKQKSILYSNLAEERDTGGGG